MNASEKNILCDSCSVYLEYLKSRNKGFERYKIKEYSILKNTLRLKLHSPLKSITDLQLEINNTVVFSFTPHDIIEYDNDEKVLICSRSSTIEKHLTAITSHDVAYIRTDLTFLIKNLLKRISSSFFHLQESVSSRLLPPDRLSFISQPSSEQLNAIDCIFSQSLSYIWGAPGTGKTRFVLSNSISHYIKNNGKVLLVAPTNKALEQMLYGVIDVLKQEGVFNQDKIVRLGTPTTGFARDFPQICETKPLHNEIQSLQMQCDLLKTARHHKQVYNDLALLDQLSDEIKEIKNIDFQSLDLKHQLKRNESAKLEVQNSLSQAQNQLYTLLKKSESKNIFRKTINLLCGERNRAKIDFLSEQVALYKGQMTSLTSALNEAQTRLIDLLSQKETLLHSAFEFLSDKQKLSSIATFIKKDMYCEAIDEIANLNQRFITPTLEFFEKHPEYVNLSFAVIEEKIAAIESEKNKLNSLQTSQRVEDANVVACTIDTLIRRIYPSDKILHAPESSLPFLLSFNPSHIFLDEAGYCSLIKAVVLFSFSCPITLLGDHMQLPPVCEINKEDIISKPRYNSISLWEIPSIYIYDYLAKGYECLFKNYRDSLCLPEIKTEMLTWTFRFGSELSTILGKHVYKRPLLSSSSSTSLYFVDASPQIEGKRGNPSEVQAISALLDNMLTDNFVIITPYREQVTLLRKALPHVDKERILTVHKSQGLEWDTVILSVSDSRLSGKWFTSSKIKISQGLQLINTAVSRAKKRLIIVCDYEYWTAQNGELLSELLNICAPYSPDKQEAEI